jgi:hypothetical protein
MRAKGNSKWTISAAIATIGALFARPEFAQAIGSVGAALVAISALLGKRH